MPFQNIKIKCYKVLLLNLLIGPVSFIASAQEKLASDSIAIAAHPEYNRVSGLHRAFWGENYRRIWGTPVKMKIFWLGKEKGGLAVTGLGGGNQTRSLQLKDSTGQEWALRSVQKYPERAIPKQFRHTVIRDVLQDAVSTSHPYSALTVPLMAEALGIQHSHPQIVYLADDPALGQYRKEFANKVYLFEERQPLDGEKAIKTEKLQKKLQKNDDSEVDQTLLLRARLLDMIMGDWDRHGDQWRWEKEDDSTKSAYRPVPRDRDKVFYTTSGIFPWFAAKGKPQLQPYREHIKNIGKWNYNARFFDLYFLNQLSKADWEKQIAYVKSHLTNEVINSAVKQLPPNIYAIDGAQLARLLMARRDHIDQDALEYYLFLAKYVDIPASDKDESFAINEQNDGSVKVTIQKIKKDDSLGHVVYQRTFNPKETKEVRLYGMGGEDVFKVSGQTPSTIKVRMIGGNDEDTFTISDSLHNKNKLFVYDRSDEKNNLPSPSHARILTSKDSTVNAYNSESFNYDHYSPKFGLGYNTEDGVRLEAGYIAEKHGFRDEPYIFRQNLTVGYTLSKQSFITTYWGDFKKIIGNNNLLVNVLVRGPRNVNNFFGLGNSTVFVNEGEKTFNYYRNRYDYAVADVRLYQQSTRWRISEGLVGQYYTSDSSNNVNHFFNEYNLHHPEQRLFATKVYAGVVLGVDYDTRNSISFPTRGVFWTTKILGLTGLNIHQHTNAQVSSVLSLYFNPGRDSVFVIADRIGGGIFAGTGEFYQMMNLGGPFSLQGYHTSRFIGKQMAFNDLELRLKLFNFNNYLLAGSLGLIAFNDAGRVWLPGENSNTIHDAFGGGLYIRPYNKLILSAVLGHGVGDNTLLYLSTGFRF